MKKEMQINLDLPSKMGANINIKVDQKDFKKSNKGKSNITSEESEDYKELKTLLDFESEESDIEQVLTSCGIHGDQIGDTDEDENDFDSDVEISAEDEELDEEDKKIIAELESDASSECNHTEYKNAVAEYPSVLKNIEIYSDMLSTETDEVTISLYQAEISELKKKKEDVELRTVNALRKYIVLLAKKYLRTINTTITYSNRKIKSYDMEGTRMSPDMENVISECITVVLEVLPKYDPSQACLTTFFSKYLIHAIKEYEQKFVTNKQSAYFNSNIRKIITTKAELREKGNDNPSIMELSEASGLSPFKIAKALDAELAASRVDVADINENSLALSKSPEEYFLEKERSNTLKMMLQNLSNVEKYVIFERNAINDSCKKKSYKQIGINPFFLELVRKEGNWHEIIVGDIFVKDKVYKGISHVPEAVVKKIEKEGVKALRLSDEFISRYGRSNEHLLEEVTTQNSEQMTININIVLSDNFMLPDEDDFN